MKRISDRLSRSVSESIDRVGDSLRSDTRFQTLAINDIDWVVEHARDELFHAGIIENRYDDGGIQIDQDVDIAIGKIVTSRDGTKQRSMSNALRPQVSFALPELLMISSRFMIYLYHKSP